jgi:hypothetical protein
MAIRNAFKIVIILLFPLSLQAQEPDITGLWKGFMFNDTTQQNYRYEIAISQEKGKFYGYSHQYFILGDKEYHGVKKLKIKRDGNEITTEEVELIVHNYPVPPAKGVHQLNTLTLEIKGSAMVLSGTYKTNRTRDFHPVTGYVHVERTNDFKQSALVPHLQELNLTKNLSFLNEAPLPEDNFVLKPLASDDDVKAIVLAAQKQQADTQIKSSASPDIKIPEAVTVKEPEIKKEAAVTETKLQPVVTKELPKIAGPALAKNDSKKESKLPVVVAKETQKQVEPTVTKPVTVVTTTPVKKPEPVIAKPAEQPVVKTVTAAVVKPAAPKPQTVPVDPTAATDLAKRKVETIKALYFKSDSLTLTLYDNGEVDGDTVSVIMNGTVIMPRVGLTTNAVRKTIYTNEIQGDSIQLVMYAESLGTLPPNTGLLIVNDGGDRYEIRFSGDMQKSSAIVFRRKKG